MVMFPCSCASVCLVMLKQLSRRVVARLTVLLSTMFCFMNFHVKRRSTSVTRFAVARVQAITQLL